MSDMQDIGHIRRRDHDGVGWLSRLRVATEMACGEPGGVDAVFYFGGIVCLILADRSDGTPVISAYNSVI